MDQYSPSYTNDRAAKDQFALLIALAALLGAAVVVVVFLGAGGPSTAGNAQVTAVAVADMQRPTTALAGTVSGVLAAPVDGPPSVVGGATKENYPWIKGKVTSLLQTDVGLWAATTAGDGQASVSLVRNPIGENPFVQQIALPANFAGAEIRALAQGLGRLYIGTSKGLLTYDFSKLAAFTPPSRYRLPGMATHLDVTALYIDHVGALWIGTRDGLLSYNGTEAFRHTIKEGLPSNVVTAISGDASGLLFVGTDKGLAAYERGIWVRHSDVDGHVNAVLAAEDNVWVGTPDGLYQRLEGKWTHFDEKTKLPNASVIGLAWSGDGVYVSTDQGLYKVAVQTQVAKDESAPKTEAGAHGAPASPAPGHGAH